jgi:hypothetical protein
MAFMTRTLTDPAVRAEILLRLARLTLDSPRRWGRMTPPQAVCHLNDSFQAMMGARSLRSVATPYTRTIMKWAALRVPMPWPPNIKTRPEIDQEVGGTKPADFTADRRALEASIDAFTRRTSDSLQAHPFFGAMSTKDWQRWGYRHLDHHLRQFGV